MTLGVIFFFILAKRCKFSHCVYFPSTLNREGLVQNVYFSLFLAFLQTKISIEYLRFFVPPTIIITKMFLYYLQRNKSFAPVLNFCLPRGLLVVSQKIINGKAH